MALAHDERRPSRPASDRAPAIVALLSGSLAVIAVIGCASSSAPPPSPPLTAAAVSAPPSALASAAPSAAPLASGSTPPSASSSAPASSASPSASSSAATPAAAPRRRAKIRFEIGEYPFPAPVVDVVLGGHPTTMIVDTGASHHVVGAWLVRLLGLPLTKSGDRAIDHAGRPMNISRVEGASLAVSGWGHVDAPFFLVADLPEPLRHVGIGGILAPQLFSPAGLATLLDFRAGTMSEEAPEDAARRLEASGGALAFSSARVCGGENIGSVLLVDALVAGRPAVLKLDSGAERTSLLQTSVAGKALLAAAFKKKKTSTGYAAAGAFIVPLAEDIKLKLGELDVTVDLNLDAGRAPAPCPSDGFLGLDVLKSCVLVVQGEKSMARCAPR